MLHPLAISRVDMTWVNDVLHVKWAASVQSRRQGLGQSVDIIEVVFMRTEFISCALHILVCYSL